MAKKTKSFTVLMPIWSIQHQAYFNPGDVVTFDMGSESLPDLAFLQAEHVLEPYKEVANATDSTNSPDSIPNGNHA